jgi:hypothetical protein
LNNQDLKSIINTACKYNDIEVLEKIASSKVIKTAGVRDLLEGLGLQLSQTANESQFKNKSELNTFIRFSGAADDLEAAKEIYNWWAKRVKEIGTSPVNVPVSTTSGTGVTRTRNISFQPRGCIREDDLNQAFSELPTNDIHNRVSALTLVTSASISRPYSDPSDPPTRFNETEVDSTGTPLGGVVSFSANFINIKKNSGSELGFLDYLVQDLRTSPPKISDNIHVKMFDVLNTVMTDKAMSSMIRKNAIAETPRAGLISNWKYICSLPKEIESRMAKTPKNLIDYKQKLALKKYGRDLSNILNTRVKFEEYVYNAGSGATAQGLNTEIPFYKINEISNSYFAEPAVQGQVKPLLERTGQVLNKIIPELDKDTSLTRKVIKNLITPSDYLNSRGKEFH